MKRPGVNFTNVLRAAFTHAEITKAQKQLNLAVFLALLGSVRVKAACKMLVKLTPGVDFISIFVRPHKLRSFFGNSVW